MKKYQSETEKAVAMATAQGKIREFLTHDMSYTGLMEKAAKAQAQVFNIIRFVDADEKEQIDVDQISEFFYFAIEAMQLLEPFEEN